MVSNGHISFTILPMQSQVCGLTDEETAAKTLSLFTNLERRTESLSLSVQERTRAGVI